MKTYIVVLLLLTVSAALSQTINRTSPSKAYVDSINLQLRAGGIHMNCESVRHGYYKAEGSLVTQPDIGFECTVGAWINWDVYRINGDDAVEYRVFVAHNANVFSSTTEATRMFVPLADLSSIVIEAYDAMGNTRFLRGFNVE